MKETPPVPSSPAHARLRVARNVVESVLLLLRDVPLPFDREAVAARLARSMQGIYGALETSPESPAHLSGMTDALSALDEVRAILARLGDAAAVPTLGRALSMLGNARGLVEAAHVAAGDALVAERSRRAALPRGDAVLEARPFLGSIGMPRLHALARGPLAPYVALDPTDDAAKRTVALRDAPPPPSPVPRAVASPRTAEQLRAFARWVMSGEAAARISKHNHPGALEEEPAPREESAPTAPSEEEALREIARDCLEDLASLGVLRTPIPTETWLDQAPFEQRLLDNLDAFASLGGSVLPVVALYHAEAEIPDVARAFAVAFTLGCIDGKDTAAAAVAVLKQSPPEERRGWIDGFSLASSPFVDVALADALRDPALHVVGVALEALARRGALSHENAVWLAGRADPAVRRLVARALATNDTAEHAISLLRRLLHEAGDDDALFLDAAESLLRRGHSGTRDLLRELLAIAAASEARIIGAARLLCLAGRATDVGPLSRVARSHPHPELARALGRFGHVATLPPLVDLLEADAREVREAAAESLERITGAGLWERVRVPWEMALPGASDDELPTEGARAVRDVVRVVQDPTSWRAWLVREGARLDPARKHRGGVAFSPALLLDELEARETPPARRCDAALELAITMGDCGRFSPDDWVARQRFVLAALRARTPALPSGRWWFGGSPMEGP